jgi:hypothetical protein
MSKIDIENWNVTRDLLNFVLPGLLLITPFVISNGFNEDKNKAG